MAKTRATPRKRLTLAALDAKIDAKIDALDAKIDAKTDALDVKVTRLSAANEARIDDAVRELRAEMRAMRREMSARFDAIDEKLRELPPMRAALFELAWESREHRLSLQRKADLERVERLEVRVDVLEGGAGRPA